MAVSEGVEASVIYVRFKAAASEVMVFSSHLFGCIPSFYLDYGRIMPGTMLVTILWAGFARFIYIVLKG